MNIAPVVQGTREWLQLRADHCTASEVPAAAGASRYMTREALMRQKRTGVGADVDERTQTLFDRGHSAEDGARPIAEEILQSELYPVTATLEVDGVALLASLDGVTLEGDIIFEHKLYSESLASEVRSGSLSPNYTLQMDQQLLVTGAKKCLFMTSDGTRERMAWCWYESTPEKAAAVVSTWKQFLADLSAYTPPEAAERTVAAPQDHLPAVSVQVSGALAVVSNLAPFGVALREFIAKIPAKPSTDQEFADTEAACKRLREAEDRLQAAEDSALASMADVNEMRRMVGEFRELARGTRLASEKLVKARKEQIREDEVRRGREAFAAFFKAECERLGGPFIAPLNPDFGNAIKGLKTLDSVRNAIDTLLAQSKVQASADAARADANLKTLAAAGSPHLFVDKASLVQKAHDDLAAVIAQRLAAEQKRLDDARIEREARERAVSTMPGTPGPYAGNVAQAAQATPSGARDGAHAEQCAPVSYTPPGTHSAPAAPPDSPPTMPLGQINERLGGILVSADLLARLGFPFTRDKASKLYHAAQFPAICAALAEHVLHVGEHQKGA